MRRVSSFFWGALLSFATSAQAEILKPEGATFVRRNEFIASGTPMTTETYNSSDAPDVVMTRYKARMARDGWKLEREVGGSTAVFSKQSSLISVQAWRLPSGETTILLSQFTPQPLAQGSGLSPQPPAPNQSSLEPDWWKRDTPGKDPDWLPRYPGSIRQGDLSSRDQRFAMVQYRADDAPERIVAFYESRMPQVGWRLARTQTFPDDLPADVKNRLPEQVGEVNGTALVFRRGNETCTISVAGEPEGSSAILVQYDQQHRRQVSRE